VDELLKLAIDGHGGARRWAQLSGFRAGVCVSGAIWDAAGQAGLLEGVVLEGPTAVPRLTITPVPRPGLRATWEPGRQIIETAGWSWFTAPFAFAREDFAAEETWPWREDGEVWRALLVTYPDPVAAQHRQQTCYFDRAGLLRRLDCQAGILGGGAAVHYPSCYREFGGIMVPTRRRVHPRGPDGLPLRDTVSLAVDVSFVTFW